MKDSLAQIDHKILCLKQKKEKLQTHLALSFFKEAQKILGDDVFTVEFALSILSHSWKNVSHQQKEEWQNLSHSFRKFSPRSHHSTAQNTAENSQI